MGVFHKPLDKPSVEKTDHEELIALKLEIKALKEIMKEQDKQLKELRKGGV